MNLRVYVYVFANEKITETERTHKHSDIENLFIHILSKIYIGQRIIIVISKFVRIGNITIYFKIKFLLNDKLCLHIKCNIFINLVTC